MVASMRFFSIALPLLRLAVANPMPHSTVEPVGHSIAPPAPTAPPTLPQIFLITPALSINDTVLFKDTGDNEKGEESVEKGPLNARSETSGFSKRQNSTLESLCGQNYVTCGSGPETGFCCMTGRVCYLDNTSTYKCKMAMRYTFSFHSHILRKHFA